MQPLHNTRNSVRECGGRLRTFLTPSPARPRALGLPGNLEMKILERRKARVNVTQNRAPRAWAHGRVGVSLYCEANPAGRDRGSGFRNPPSYPKMAWQSLKLATQQMFTETNGCDWEHESLLRAHLDTRTLQKSWCPVPSCTPCGRLTLGESAWLS